MTPADPSVLPSLASLHRASIGAVLGVIVLAVTVVLPAERGVDPTGIGGLLGLTQIGEMKQGPVEDAAPAEQAWELRTETVAVTIAAGRSTEVKASMRAGDEVVYSWTSDNAKVFFDFHGEPKGGASGEFTSFEKGTLETSSGTFVAPFEGTHGWYWKNKGTGPTTITLEATGVYRNLRELR
jgi:hypothetical protein